MANLFSNISKAVLLRAVEIKGKIEELESQLSTLFSGNEISLSASASIKPRGAGKRKMSPAARAKISAAAKARWAKVKGDKSPEPEKNSGAVKPVKRKTVSAATKAKLRAVAKKRWAKAKAAGKTVL